jgi:hypothetical protein
MCQAFDGIEVNFREKLNTIYAWRWAPTEGHRRVSLRTHASRSLAVAGARAWWAVARGQRGPDAGRVGTGTRGGQGPDPRRRRWHPPPSCAACSSVVLVQAEPQSHARTGAARVWFSTLREINDTACPAVSSDTALKSITGPKKQTVPRFFVIVRVWLVLRILLSSLE